MKKAIFTMSFISLLLLGSALTACGGNTSTTSNAPTTGSNTGTSTGTSTGKPKQTINIQFVPSNDPGKLATLATEMEPLLEQIEPDYKFSITTGTSYAATTTALLSDQIDIGFLTASGYAEVSLKHSGKVDVLMTSVRKGYQVQIDYKTEADQIKAMNGEIEGYTYRGEQSTEDVNWYTSQLIVRADKYVDKNKDGKIDILDMAGLKIGRQGVTSGAGYLRPLKYLYDHGMEMVDKITDASKQIQGVELIGYSAVCNAMMNGDIDGFWGYTDVRYSNFYSKEGEHYHDDKLFTDYKVVAITDGIYNDTISARANLDTKAKEAVKHAFKELVKQGSIDEKGTGAYLLYNLYSHTGYTDAEDADFKGEKEFYQFCVDHDLL